MANSQDIISAPWFSLTAWPVKSFKDYEDAVGQVMAEHENNNRQRKTSEAYRAATEVLVSNLFSSNVPYWRFRSSSRWKLDDLDNPARLKQSQVLRVLAVMQSMGWIRLLDYGKEVFPLFNAKAANRFEVLSKCPVVPMPDKIGFHPNSSFISLKQGGGFADFSHYSKADQSVDQALLKRFNDLILNSRIEMNGSKLSHSKPLVRMFKGKLG